ncbi:MAG: hypothetical protein AAFR98_09875 [Pseudomonadota bacterium]
MKLGQFQKGDWYKFRVVGGHGTYTYLERRGPNHVFGEDGPGGPRGQVIFDNSGNVVEYKVRNTSRSGDTVYHPHDCRRTLGDCYYTSTFTPNAYNSVGPKETYKTNLMRRTTIDDEGFRYEVFVVTDEAKAVRVCKGRVKGLDIRGLETRMNRNCRGEKAYFFRKIAASWD